MTGRVSIHKTAIIEDTAVLMGDVTIGKDVYIGHYSVIGAPPQHKGWYPSPVDGRSDTRGVVIDDRTCIREHVTIHQGILLPTTICDNVLIMAGCHISHDSRVERDVTMAAMCTLAGFTHICEGATLGQGVVTHPWTVIGQVAMVGLNSSVVENVLPYQKVAGSPARLIGKNTGAGGDRERWDETRVDPDTWDKYASATQLQEALQLQMKEMKK